MITTSGPGVLLLIVALAALFLIALREGSHHSD